MPYSVGSVYQRAGGDRTESRSRSRLLGLFGVLFAAAGWRGIWASSWSYERVAALVMFVVGIIVVGAVTANVISFLRQR